MTEPNILYTHITDISNCLIPKRIGAYVITHTPDNVHVERYVGSTNNLFVRMYKHHNKKIIYIDIYITDDINLAESLERILMKLIEPATNIQNPPLSNNDKELMNELIEGIILKEHISSNIIKIGYRYLKYVNKNNKHRTFIRKLSGYKNQLKINVPAEFGFTPDEYVEIIKESDNVFKIIKVDVVPKETTNKQLEISNEKGKIVTLTEVSNAIVRKEMESMSKEDIIKEIK